MKNNREEERRMGTKWMSGLVLAASVLGAVTWGAAQDALETAPTGTATFSETDDAVVLNFELADIREVIHSLATALGLNYVIDPRIQGQVTVRTTGKISRRDLFPVFQQILRSHGISMVRIGEVHHFVPVGEAKTRATLSSSPGERRRARDRDAFVVELVKINHIAAEEMAKVLQPFVSPGGDVIAYPRGNLIILSDIASSVERLKELVHAFDTNTFRELRSKIYRIEHANVEDLGDELKGILEPYGVTAKSAEERGVYIIPLARLNLVVVIGFNPEVFAEVDRWVAMLDVPPEKGGGRTVHVYQVENAKAADLADVLSGLYGGDGGGGGSSGRRRTGGLTSGVGGGQGGAFGGGGRSGRGSRGESGSSEGTGGSFGGNSSRSRRGGGGGGGSTGGTQTILIAPREGEKPIFKEEVRIVADEITNSLVILATARDFGMIKGVVRKLDVVPRQVLIEAMIAEVGLTGDLEFGVEYAFANRGIGSLLGTIDDDGGDGGGDGSGGTGGGLSNSTLLQAAKRGARFSEADGLFAFITDRDQFLVLLRALASRTRLNILSTPHVLAADNREAHILIGEEVPILTQTQQSIEFSSDRLLSSIQYRDTGKILTILPQVNSAGLVNMEIRQEVSAVGQQVFGNTNSPSFISREAETTVVVQSGESVLIGGIIDDQISRSRRGIPFLMDLPVLGRLFRVDREMLNRTELIVLITPHVIRDRLEARAVTKDFEGRIRGLKQMIERVRSQPSETQAAPEAKGLEEEMPLELQEERPFSEE